MSRIRSIPLSRPRSTRLTETPAPAVHRVPDKGVGAAEQVDGGGGAGDAADRCAAMASSARTIRARIVVGCRTFCGGWPRFPRRPEAARVGLVAGFSTLWVPDHAPISGHKEGRKPLK